MKTKMSTKTTELRMIMEDLKRKLVRRMMMKLPFLFQVLLPFPLTKMIMMKMMLMKMMRKRKKSSNHLPKNNKKNEWIDIFFCLNKFGCFSIRIVDHFLFIIINLAINRNFSIYKQKFVFIKLFLKLKIFLSREYYYWRKRYISN